MSHTMRLMKALCSSLLILLLLLPYGSLGYEEEACENGECAWDNEHHHYHQHYHQHVEEYEEIYGEMNEQEYWDYFHYQAHMHYHHGPGFKEEEEHEPLTAEDAWGDEGTLLIMTEFLGCQDRESMDYELHNQTTWDLLHSTYASVIPKDLSSLPTTDEAFASGFQVATTVDVFPTIGRGVLAAEDIPKGSMVWKSRNTARFTNGAHYREYLKSLPRDLACDVLVWAYTRRGADKEVLVCVDLDQGSYVNEGFGNEEINCGLLKDDKHTTIGCDFEIYALRDIRAGEQLLLDYGTFSTKEWYYLGLE